MARPKRSSDRVKVDGIWLRKLNPREIEEFKDSIGRSKPVAILLESNQTQRLISTGHESKLCSAS